MPRVLIFLFCKLLPTRTTGKHIFQLLNEFIEENGIGWKKCIRVCTDGARAMTGEVDCSIHCETLAVKKIPEDLKSVSLQMFLHDQQSPLASLFDDPVWLVKLAYLADIICTHMVWHFGAAVCDVIAVHLLSLEEQFSEYFPVEATPELTIYLCEKGFSALNAINTKCCNKMDAEPDLRLNLTALIPDIARLSLIKQAHPSH
ncbi:ZBED5 protein, partial [Atractosteus spatula]|nr:ZBED5 protein [Atractosteus spatula]